ncbi:MAG: hypothetical protein ACRDVM_05485, partial [Acidimicrobiia bacterium]
LMLPMTSVDWAGGAAGRAGRHGKTTLAAAMTRAGHRLLGEDSRPAGSGIGWRCGRGPPRGGSGARWPEVS